MSVTMDGRSSTGSSRAFYTGIVAACLNGIAVGNLAGWPQAAIPQLISPPPESGPTFTESEVSWIAGIFFVGMLTGGFTSLAVAGVFGKRKLFLLASLPLIVGWSVIAVADSFWKFVLGRIVLGLGGGMMCHQTEMYLSEISPSRLRSSMSVLFCVCVHTGVLLTFAIGPSLTISSATGFYLAVVLLLAGTYLVGALETPFWLVKQGMYEDALDNLRRLRGIRDVHQEFDEIVEFVETSKKGDEKTEGVLANLWRVLGDTANRKAVLLVVLLTTAQQFSGMAALHSYAQLTFERSSSAIPGRYVSLLLGVIELCCTLASSCVIERLGRRPLVALSLTTCSGSMALLGLYFHGLLGDKDTDGGVLPIVCIVVFAVAYGLGLATMATVVAAECLSMDARNLGAAAQNTTVCFSIFVITKLWQMISTTYGQEYSFWTAAIITGAHTVILLIMLPETRGRSLTEIQSLLAGKSPMTSSLRNVQIVPASNRLIVKNAKDGCPLDVA